jgi:DNA adenine methylase
MSLIKKIDTNKDIVNTINKEMDLNCMSKTELLSKCEELGIKKVKSKNKNELIEIINKSIAPKKKFQLIIEESEEKSDNSMINLVLESDTEVTNEICLPYEKQEPYLENFLKSITNKNGTYKRVCISPLRYAGGKTKAIGLILENLPKLKEKKIVSPFFGGGSVELCLSQMLDIKVIGYDIFNMLANFWNVLINNKDEFVEELSKFKITEEEFTYNRHVLLNYWDKIKPSDLVYETKKKIELKQDDLTKLDNNEIIQAVYYYYNMTLSYGPMFLGWPSSNEINKEKFQRRIEKLKQLNLKNLQVSCAAFEDILENHANDFLFLDPPYYLEGDSKMFKGMYPNCNFAIHHNNFNHQKLAELLKKHRGGFLITYNNCLGVRELYKDCKFEYPEWQYTYGQGETRIGKNRQQTTNDNIKESHEIIIIKWPQ